MPQRADQLHGLGSRAVSHDEIVALRRLLRGKSPINRAKSNLCLDTVCFFTSIDAGQAIPGRYDAPVITWWEVSHVVRDRGAGPGWLIIQAPSAGVAPILERWQ